MKKMTIVNLEKQLLQDLPGFALKETLMYLPPVRPILRGIAFDGSSFDKLSFSVIAFLLPLCVPTKHLYFNFGKRIRDANGGDRWSVNKVDIVPVLTEALKSQAVPFIARVVSLGDFVEAAKKFSQVNPHTLRAIAYSFARSGQLIQASNALDELLDQLDRTVTWQLDMATEAAELKEKLTADPSDALYQLEVWEAETERNLGLIETDP